MKLEWDGKKALANLRKHGLRFEDASRFGFDSAFEIDVTLREYGERRMRAIGVLDEKVVVLIYALCGTGIRIISMRRATRTEIEEYVDYLES